MVFSAFLLSFQNPGDAVKSSFSAILAFIAAESKTPPDFVDCCLEFGYGRFAFL
jgi:5-carboxymethyl-2-hydroxymuconate isomerase